jgi:hypothetical protein
MLTSRLRYDLKLPHDGCSVDRDYINVKSSVGEVSAAHRYLPPLLVTSMSFEQHATFCSHNNNNNNKQFTIDAAAIVPPHKIAPRPAPSTARKKTSTTDVNSVARHHYSYRPHLHHWPGSRLCVFPRKLIPQRRSWLTTTPAWLMAPLILTYGWLPPSLNLGWRRDHTARNPSSQDTDDELPTLMA